MRTNPAADTFARGPGIELAAQWLSATAMFLNRALASIGPINFDEPSEHAFQKVVHPEALRIRRHIAALWTLTYDSQSPQTPPYTDGAHTILKSLFELVVECALCLTYKEIFGVGPDASGHFLHQRVYRYAEFVKKRSNYRKFFTSQEILGEYLKPEIIEKLPKPERDYFRRGKIHARKELDLVAKQIQYNDTPYWRVNHWFPERDAGRSFFIHHDKDKDDEPARDVGSVAWRCKAILAKHYPVESCRGLWSLFYDNYYDILNQRTHPSLGFDDVFRPESERVFDYTEQLVGLRQLFHQCLIPLLREAFSQWWLPPAILMEDLERLHRLATSQVLAAWPDVHRDMTC